MRGKTLLTWTLGAAVATATLPLAGQQQAGVTIDQWQVPYDNARPRDPSVAPDGSIFFVGQRASGNYVARFDPETETFTRFALPDGTLPHTNAVGDDGIVWVAGNGNGTIVRLDPRTRETRVIPVTLEGSRRTDPHTMVFDGRGGLWFTAQNTHFVGHLDLETEEIRTVRTSPAGTRSGPYGIVVDQATGRPWFVLFHTNKLGTIDPETMALHTFDLPNPRSRPRRLARTDDGMLWYVDYSRGYLGMLDPDTGEVEEWRSPSGENARGYGMTLDDAGRIWYAETGVQPNRMVAFDTAGKAFVYNEAIPGAGRNGVRHMVFDSERRVVWYGSDVNFIGAVRVPPAM